MLICSLPEGRQLGPCLLCPYGKGLPGAGQEAAEHGFSSWPLARLRVEAAMREDPVPQEDSTCWGLLVTSLYVLACYSFLERICFAVNCAHFGFVLSPGRGIGLLGTVSFVASGSG